LGIGESNLLRGPFGGFFISNDNKSIASIAGVRIYAYESYIERFEI